MTEEKSFITLTPGDNVMKHFSLSLTKRYKLEPFQLGPIFSVKTRGLRRDAPFVLAHQPKWHILTWLKGLVRTNAPNRLASLSGITS